MLAELSEREATGDIARIYREIRETAGVPYVSSLQRHLATRPGWLEWSWAAVRPAFMDGSAPEAAWRAAAEVGAQPLPKLSRDAIQVLGVDAAGERAIRDVCDTFVRAAPANLMLSGLIRMLLDGQRPSGVAEAQAAVAWRAPDAVAGLPALAGPDEMPPEAWRVMMQLGCDVAGQPFVPGFYRMLGHWPGYLAHVATVLGPRFGDAATKARCADVLARIDAAVPDVFQRLPALGAEPPMPAADEFGPVLDVLGRYRQTSPEMIVFGRLIRDALPDNDNKEIRL